MITRWATKYRGKIVEVFCWHKGKKPPAMYIADGEKFIRVRIQEVKQ